MLDAERIIEDANIVDVASRLNIVMSDDMSRVSPDGNNVKILCPYHDDHNFGSAFLVVKEKNGKVFKGLHCWACGANKSIVNMVADLQDWSVTDDYPKILEFIADGNGGVSQYYIGKSQLKKESCEAVDGLPDPLSAEEMATLGFVRPQINCYLNATQDKYEASTLPLEKGQSFIRKDTVNYEDVFNPLVSEWVLVQRENYSINELYREDFISYRDIVVSKCKEILASIEVDLGVYKNINSNSAADIRYGLKKKKKIIEKIVSRLTDVPPEIISREEKKHFSLEKQDASKKGLERMALKGPSVTKSLQELLAIEILNSKTTYQKT